jgi:hypothetical protein
VGGDKGEWLGKLLNDFFMAPPPTGGFTATLLFDFVRLDGGFVLAAVVGGFLTNVFSLDRTGAVQGRRFPEIQNGFRNNSLSQWPSFTFHGVRHICSLIWLS